MNYSVRQFQTHLPGNHQISVFGYFLSFSAIKLYSRTTGKLTIFVPDSSLQIRTGWRRRKTPPPPPRLLMPLESSKRQERSIGNLSRKGFPLAAMLFIIIYWITYTSRAISAKDISCHRSFIDNESCLFILNFVIIIIIIKD